MAAEPAHDPRRSALARTSGALPATTLPAPSCATGKRAARPDLGQPIELRRLPERAPGIDDPVGRGARHGSPSWTWTWSAASPASRSRRTGRTAPACGATPSTRCARISRASRRPWRTPSSPATPGPATWSWTRSLVAARFALQACVEGRLGVGNDLNPFAHVLTAAKVDPPTAGEAAARLARLRIDWSFEAAGWEALGDGLVRAAAGALAAGEPATGGGGHAVPVPASRSPGPDRAVRWPGRRAGPARGRARLSPAHARPAAVRPEPPGPRGSDGPVPGRGRDRDPPREEPRATSPS